MQVKQIHLENFRGIEKLTVGFDAGVNLIIGNNGAGKSSLLGGISAVLRSSLLGLIGVHAGGISKSDVRVVSNQVGTVTESIQYCTPVTLSCLLEFDGTDYDLECYQDNDTNGVRQDTFNAVRRMKELMNDKDSRLPLLSYQSDRRQIFRETKAPDPRGQVERRQGYEYCLEGTSSVDKVQDWCAQMDYAGYRLGHEATEYLLFKKIVSHFITELEGNNNVHVEFSPRLNRLVYSENGSDYFVHNLSAGYQSALCLVMELAYRTALLNPSLEDLGDLEGLAVIDEIDMHLHPRWQWKILGALRATFPRVQFIIATHSPIVLSSAENAKLILMKNPNEIQEFPDVYGYNVGDVLELTQGSLDMPQEVKDWRSEIEQALDENDLAKAESIVKSSEEKLGHESSAVKRMKEFLAVNKWIVED